MKNPLGEPLPAEEMVGSSTITPSSPKLREVLQGARANWQALAGIIGQENMIQNEQLDYQNLPNVSVGSPS